MILTEAVIEQSIVLASILAGFGLAIAAQIALQDDTAEHKLKIATDFLRSSILSILAVIFGIAFFSIPEGSLENYVSLVLANISNIFIVVSIFYFFRSISNLATSGFGLKRSWVLNFAVNSSLIILVITIALTIIYVTVTSE